MTTTRETASRETNSTLYSMDLGELAEHLGEYLERHGWTDYAEAVFESLVTRYTEACDRTRFECSLILREELSHFAGGTGIQAPGVVRDLAARPAAAHVQVVPAR